MFRVRLISHGRAQERIVVARMGEVYSIRDMTNEGYFDVEQMGSTTGRMELHGGLSVLLQCDRNKRRAGCRGSGSDPTSIRKFFHRHHRIQGWPNTLSDPLRSRIQPGPY
jgi:hypothetical protein